jgi:superoxide dismutase
VNEVELIGTKITASRVTKNHEKVSKASDLYFSKAKVYENSATDALHEYFSTILKPRSKREEDIAEFDAEMEPDVSSSNPRDTNFSSSFDLESIQSQFDQVLKNVFK